MNWDEYFMRHVYLSASKSKDPRTKIGAVLVRDNRLISSGFNGFPYKVNDTTERYNDRNTKLKFVVHAEANAVLQCALLGHSSKDTTLYTLGIPCNECAKSIIQAGIRQIICHKQWTMCHWDDVTSISNIMFNEAGIEILWFDKKLGLFGMLDGKEIEV